MAASIPASDIVNILPGVIGVGGTGLDMVGMLLTSTVRAPYGSVLSFVSASAVADYFGPSSDEALAATTYFNGYVDSFIKPAFLLFAPFATAARSGWIRGGALGLTLAQLQAITPGTLTITFAGTGITSSSINLSGATSFSNAATIIQAAFTTPPFTVTYDSIADAFLFTSTATGATQTIIYATGAIAASLKLTQATGAVLSQGAAIDDASTFMDEVVAVTQDFVSFTTLYSASDADIVKFATWTNGKANRYLYVGWTSNSAATGNSDTSSPAYLARQAELSGTAFVWSPTYDKAVFVLGYVASLDFNRTNGRAVAAFRSGTGLTADVTNQTIAANLIANGYSFYGSYATANDTFVWLYNGSVSGSFAWIDSYVNQIWLNNAFQLSLMALLGNIGQIPYNDDGYDLIANGIQTNINDAVDFGAIRSGITLSEAQKSEMQNIVGFDISDVMFTRGWYLAVQDPGATVRAARGSPICTFFYTDGSSVQRINLSSLMVQ